MPALQTLWPLLVVALMAAPATSALHVEQEPPMAEPQNDDEASSIYAQLPASVLTDGGQEGEQCPPQYWVAVSTSPPFVTVNWDCLPP